MAEGNVFAVEVVTPERVLLTGRATEVVLRTAEGDLTFLAGHTPLIGTAEPGVVRVTREDGEVERVASHGGFAQVEQGVALDADADGDGDAEATGTRVTLLLGVAELVGEVDVERARAALEAAEARLAELGAPGGRAAGESEEVDPEMAAAEADRRRAQVRLDAVEEPAAAG